MPLIVGNLLTDPAAQSFISLTDAVGYLEAEAAGQLTGTPIGDWITMDAAEQEASLVAASRWLAYTFRWHPLTEVTQVRVGHVATRLAVETVGRRVFAGTDTSQVVASESVGSISISYRAGNADAAGLSLPWLKLALYGLVRGNTSWLLRG